MQNSLNELHSLIQFLRIKPYDDHKLFTRDISQPLGHKDSRGAQANRKIQALLTAIMLRRTKDSRIDGKEILNLPEKHNTVDYVTMGEEERAKYVEIEAGAQKTMRRAMQEARSSTGANMLVLLLKLRQTCDHPLLTGDQARDVTTVGTSEGIKLAKALHPTAIPSLKRQALEGFQCPICLDVVSAGITIISPCGHFSCGECITEQLNLGVSLDDVAEPANCPVCRTSFNIKSCISLHHFLKVHCPEKHDVPTENYDGSTDEKPKYLLNFWDKGKANANMQQFNERAIVERFEKKYNMPVENFAPSAKVQKLFSLILDVQSTGLGEKIIVFSQFTGFLDLVEIPLVQAGISFLRYDGSLNAVRRNEALLKFEQDPSYNVILVSLKAGNVGLNLTCANHVILAEPFWNPYVETQAEDRAHRIGQKKEVHVHRLIIQDSVESRVLAIQEKKKALIEGAMDPAQAAAITKLTRGEIAFLFGMSSRA